MSRKDTDMRLTPSERASKIIIIHLRDHSFDGLGPEISWVKEGPGEHGGGWGLGPGGECFAPHCASARPPGHLSGHSGLPNGL